MSVDEFDFADVAHFHNGVATLAKQCANWMDRWVEFSNAPDQGNDDQIFREMFNEAKSLVNVSEDYGLQQVQWGNECIHSETILLFKQFFDRMLDWQLGITIMGGIENLKTSFNARSINAVMGLIGQTILENSNNERF